jgi:hypothetical protein
MKSTVFFTMQTSATASMWRVFITCLKCSPKKYVPLHFLHKYFVNGNISDIKDAVMPKDDHFIQFNNPPHFNKSVRLDDYRFIINIRDPRDRLCNAFHWTLVHPHSPDEDKKIIEERASKILEQGIDNWVLKHLTISYFDNLFYVLENSEKKDVEVLSYARLCCDFDSFVNKYCDFMGIEVTESLLNELEIERVDNLSENAKWIGNRWGGSDIMPGRYKNELKPETILKINEFFDPVLRKMAYYDPDYSDLYLEGLDSK